MKRNLTALAAAFVVTSTLVVAQQARTQPPPPPPVQTPAAAQDITITGCLAQGSGPTVFILEDAKLNPQDRNEQAKTYVVVTDLKEIDFTRHVNHSVSVKGVAETKAVPMPPAGRKVAEKDLPRFTVKTLTMVADTCTSAGH
jgi:hypothetical protein